MVADAAMVELTQGMNMDYPELKRDDLMELAELAGVAPNTIHHFEAAFLRFADLLTKKLDADRAQRAAPVSEAAHTPFKAMAQGETDYSVDVFPIESTEFGSMMTIGAQEGAIYITKQQAMNFWNLTDATPQPVEVQPVMEIWKPMATAPKDGTLIRLLVDFEDHATEDGEGPHPTIGSNTWDNHHDFDVWLFAGWCWTQDCYTQGVGTPVGWLPMLGNFAQPVALEPLAEIEIYKKALIYVAFALHGTRQYQLAKGITLVDGDRVQVEIDGISVDTGHMQFDFGITPTSAKGSKP